MSPRQLSESNTYISDMNASKHTHTHAYYIYTHFTAYICNVYIYIYYIYIDISYPSNMYYVSHISPNPSISHSANKAPNRGGRTHYWQSEEETKNVQVGTPTKSCLGSFTPSKHSRTLPETNSLPWKISKWCIFHDYGSLPECTWLEFLEVSKFHFLMWDDW